MPGILTSGTLPSTLKCAGVLYKLVKSSFVNTLRMHAFLWKSCVTWLVHPFPVMSVTMLALWGECVSTGWSTFGLLTVFFTHGAADLQWPELANLICQDSPEDASARRHPVIDNLAVADWFFYERFQQFLKCFYLDILGAKDCWLRFEWQHHGSPHVHGLAWLPGPPDVQLFINPAVAEENRR